MKKFEFKKIDAFATNTSDGNPAGYIRLNSFDDINDKDMLKIANQLKGFVNEVGYVAKAEDDKYKFRYFSSEREVEFCESNGLDIIEVFCKETVNLNNTYRTRVFAPTFGYLEDPATGSGNSAFGYYLLKHELWDGEVITLEQNKYSDRYNIIKLKAEIDSDKVTRVLFGGGAIVRIEGMYNLV